LVVFKNAVPATAGTPAARNLPSLFYSFLAASFAWTAIPRPVHAGFRAARIVRNLEQALTGLMLTNKAA
jgi:hypothetical protein